MQGQAVEKRGKKEDYTVTVRREFEGGESSFLEQLVSFLLDRLEEEKKGE